MGDGIDGPSGGAPFKGYGLRLRGSPEETSEGLSRQRFHLCAMPPPVRHAEREPALGVACPGVIDRSDEGALRSLRPTDTPERENGAVECLAVGLVRRVKQIVALWRGCTNELFKDVVRTVNPAAISQIRNLDSFIRRAPDIATALYYTGRDPFTGQEVYVAKGLRDRKMQRALMQFFKPENWFTVREALIQAGRQDLIGSGCDCLIPAQPPKEAIEARRRRANDADHYHSVANPAQGGKPGERGLPNQGYRPGRKTASRQNKKPRRNGSGPCPRP